MSDYGPQFTAARLFRKQSTKGTTYFVGRMGLLKVALLKSKDTADDGSEIWNLVVSEAPQKPRDNSAKRDVAAPQSTGRTHRFPQPDTDRRPSGPDDVIPF